MRVNEKYPSIWHSHIWTPRNARDISIIINLIAKYKLLRGTLLSRSYPNHAKYD